MGINEALTLAGANEDLIRIILVYVIPFALSATIYWLMYDIYDIRKRMFISILSFIGFLSLFWLSSMDALRIAIIYVVPFIASIMVYINTDQFKEKKRILISILIFIVLLSVLFILLN